jgi:hypothetical protein
VDLSDLADPRFDLEVQAELPGGEPPGPGGAGLGDDLPRGRYTAPRVTGAIRVDQANLFLEEFARSADRGGPLRPAFLAAVDTTLAAARPVLEAAQNPFLENLRVDADLSMPRDVWLRSREMNVEIGGDLIVTFDRRDREILLVGTVAAVRGNYNAFGRQFQVRSGTVDFVGTPGINPALDIEAVHRLRQQGGEPLEIVANLEGTLLSPASPSAPAAVNISESDLISYLIFGRPSYALASAESRMLGDAAISAGIGAAAGQLSSLLGQQIGLDFFNITQAQDRAGLRGPERRGARGHPGGARAVPDRQRLPGPGPPAPAGDRRLPGPDPRCPGGVALHRPLDLQRLRGGPLRAGGRLHLRRGGAPGEPDLRP